VRKASSAQAPEYERIGWIRQDDVMQARHEAEAATSPFSAGRRVRVAILPHLPLDRMTFEPGNEAVQLARELRMHLRALPGVEFKDAGTVKDRFRLVKSQGVEGEALLQMLATALGVDYIVWGTLNRTGGAVEASTAIYDQAAGRQLAAARTASNPNAPASQLGADLTDGLVRRNVTIASDQRLKGMFAALVQDQARSSMLVMPVALDGARSPLLEGAEALEQSLALPVDAPEAVELLDSARANLEEAAKADADNPLVRFLLSSALYNQARARQQASDVDGARKLMSEFARQLRDAFRLRDRREGDIALRTEIEGDYALLVRGNVEDAVALYRRLLDESQAVDSDAARHAHWMLAGIYSGDWGVDAKFVDRDQAKRSLVQILAIWPDSSEAQFIRRALRWNDAEGGSQFPNFPRENDELAEMVDRSA
jgi:tetratricopeptide (TPR) repeat protein